MRISSFFLLSTFYFLLSTFYFLLLVSPVEAAVGLTIQPVKISHTIKPGETVSGTILLKNASDDEEVEVSLKVEDFMPVAGAEGIQFVGRAPGVTTVRDWITLQGDSSFVFQKGESRNIGYTIAAPTSAEPGSHFGVLLFKASKLQEEGQLKVGTQVGVLVFVTVPGNYLQKGKILEFSGPTFIQRPPALFKIKFENTGTVHFEPKGAIKITNIFGKEVGSVPIEGQVILPTNVKEFLVEWRPAGLLLGRYLATAVIIDGEGNRLTSETWSFYAAPVAYAAGFIVALIVIFFLLRFIRSRIKINISLK